MRTLAAEVPVNTTSGGRLAVSCCRSVTIPTVVRALAGCTLFSLKALMAPGFGKSPGSLDADRRACMFGTDARPQADYDAFWSGRMTARGNAMANAAPPVDASSVEVTILDTHNQPILSDPDLMAAVRAVAGKLRELRGTCTGELIVAEAHVRSIPCR